jgi:F0F1-type ATP synthase membrane subunit b/b'
MKLIFINVETFVLQFIILVIVLYVLNKYIFKPYLAYLDEESIRQEKLLQDYNNIDSLLREAEEKKESILEEARNSAKSIIEEAEGLAKKK